MKNKVDLEDMLEVLLDYQYDKIDEFAEYVYWLSTGYRRAKDTAPDEFLDKMVEEIERVYLDVIDNYKKETIIKTTTVSRWVDS